MSKFVIIGQARSGTTFVQTLLNSHPDVHCRGELFDAWQIDDDGKKDTRLPVIQARDSAPADFLERYLNGDGLASTPPVLGFKMLVQHHPALLSEILPNHPDISIIYVSRDNKLAQFASDLQVKKTGKWTSTDKAAIPPKVHTSPLWATAQSNLLQNEDFLLSKYLDTLPNPMLKVRYSDIRNPNFGERLLSFLKVRNRPLKSRLQKQGQNTVLDRFENAQEIAQHFHAIGRGDWLKAEL